MKITFEERSYTTGGPGVDITFMPQPVDGNGVNDPELYKKIAAEGAVDLPDGARFIGKKGAIMWSANEAHYASAKEFADNLQKRVSDALDAYRQFDRFHRVRFAIQEEAAREGEEERVKS